MIIFLLWPPLTLRIHLKVCISLVVLPSLQPLSSCLLGVQNDHVLNTEITAMNTSVNMNVYSILDRFFLTLLIIDHPIINVLPVSQVVCIFIIVLWSPALLEYIQLLIFLLNILIINWLLRHKAKTKDKKYLIAKWPITSEPFSWGIII